MIFTPFTFVYLATSIVAFTVGWLAYRRKAVVGAQELAILTFSVAFTAFILSFESAAPDQAGKILCSKISYISVVLIPEFYLLFVLRFTKLIRFKEIKNGWMLFVFPFITLMLAYTNEYHHLIWSGFSPVSPITNLIIYHHGFWFWTGYTMYSYLMIMASTYFLYEFLRNNRFRKVYVIQGWLVSLAGLCPWFVSFFYIFDLTPVKGLDITTISTTLSSILFSWSILKSTFLNLVPMARETLVETLPIGIMALDDQNRIQDINGTAKSFLDIRTKDIFGLTLPQIMSDSSHFSTAIQSEETPLQVEIQMEDNVKSYKIIKQPLKNNFGSRLITIFDVTDEIAREKDLIYARLKAEESDKLKSAFLSNLSHEIRTPMNGIMGFISILQSEKLTDAERTEYLNIVWSNGDRLLKTMVDIIDISKIESGQIDVNFSVVNMKETLESLYEFFKPEAVKRNLEFSYSNRMDSENNMIYSDQIKIFSILTNLIKNALKYTTEGFVKYDCCLEGNELCFSVSDSGIGIPADKMEVIFDRFIQVDSSRKRKHEGSGLGLSITKAYVEILGGTIRVQSKEQAGSTFFVRIPIEIVHH